MFFISYCCFSFLSSFPLSLRHVFKVSYFCFSKYAVVHFIFFYFSIILFKDTFASFVIFFKCNFSSCCWFSFSYAFFLHPPYSSSSSFWSSNVLSLSLLFSHFFKYISSSTSSSNELSFSYPPYRYFLLVVYFRYHENLVKFPAIIFSIYQTPVMSMSC